MVSPNHDKDVAHPRVSYQIERFPPNGTPPLLADGMLGTLAKWLRLLGYDTAYDTFLDDHALARWARAEGRLLLTRDHQLAMRPGLRSLFIHHDALEGQLAQVLEAIGPPPAGALPRCPVCNGQLIKVVKAEVRDAVPPYVYQTQEQFHRCGGCERIYWRGTHWQRIEAIRQRWTARWHAPPLRPLSDG